MSQTLTLTLAIATSLRSEKPLNAAALHRLRREFSKHLRDWDGQRVIALAHELSEDRGVPRSRMIACGLVGNHAAALCALTPADLERLAGELECWGDVDLFACLVAGIAWRDGGIQTKTIHKWAKSRDRWWRRAALASTVPLNVRSRRGRGDPERTLKVCHLLVKDRDDAIMKALS